jgi:hypothetical protein
VGLGVLRHKYGQSSYRPMELGGTDVIRPGIQGAYPRKRRTYNVRPIRGVQECATAFAKWTTQSPDPVLGRGGDLPMRVGITTFGGDGGESGISAYVVKLLEQFARMDVDREWEIVMYEGERSI